MANYYELLYPASGSHATPQRSGHVSNSLRCNATYNRSIWKVLHFGFAVKLCHSSGCWKWHAPLNIFSDIKYTADQSNQSSLVDVACALCAAKTPAVCLVPFAVKSVARSSRTRLSPLSSALDPHCSLAFALAFAFAFSFPSPSFPLCALLRVRR